jgi:PAS domain S-box-containing protein
MKYLYNMAFKNENALLSDQIYISEMLLDSSIDRVMAIDHNWNIIAWNHTSELISGINKKNVIGKKITELFPQILQDQEMMDAIEVAFKGRKSFLPSLTNAFNRHYSENHFIPLKDHRENVIGVMNIIHDVAHRIKVEKQLQKLNIALEKKYNQLEKANSELATFTYITSRDIKEPLKHVYTSLELLIKKEGATLSNLSKGNLRRMQGSLNKMNLLIDDITAVAGISTKSEQLSSVDLEEILVDTTTTLRNKINEKKAIIEAATLPQITGYKKMLEYLFLHIIDNALKFHDENTSPRIIINCKYVIGDEENKRNLLPGKEYLKISFQDNGIGFRNEDAERIFNLFEKLNDRKYHGSGVGLTISRKIVEAHDGFIDAVSSPGNGAIFNCYFPVEQEE